MTRLRVMLVGRRRGALLAAARLDAEVLLLDDAGRPHRAAGAHDGARVRFDDVEGCVAEAIRLAAGRKVDAVIALVERSVLPAAAIRAALGVPGATPADALPWRDKLEMKRRVRDAGVPCADHARVERDSDAAQLVARLGLPMVVKPRSSSGSRGTVVARTEAEVRAALADGCMAESFVSGVELSVESFLVDGEVRFENVTEYVEVGWSNVVPASFPARIERAARRMSRAAIEALGVRDGVTHVEGFVVDSDPAREPVVYFGELAARPPGGALMELMSLAYGFDPWVALLQISVGIEPALPAGAVASAGVVFLHPGEGEVTRIEGLEEARAVPGVLEVDCPLQVGQRIPRRVGTGQHTGRILVRTWTRDAAVEALTKARALVRLEVDSRAA